MAGESVLSRFAASGVTRRTLLRGIVLTAGAGVLSACAAPAPPAATSAPTAAPKPTDVPKPAAPAATAAPAAAAASPVAKPAASPAAAAPTTAPSPAAAAASGVDMAAIEAAANKEGAVTLYSSFNVDEFNQIYPIFQKRYPQVKVDHIRGNGEQLVQRMLTEIKGGKVLVDVLETNSFDVFNVVSENLFEPFAPPEAAAYPASLKDANNLWVSTRQNVDCIAYNTDLVKPGQAPAGYDDLADPKWMGKIMVEATDMEMFAGLYAGKFGSDMTKASDWLKKVGANKPEGFTGHTETTELLAAGQNALFFGAYAHRIEALKLKKAPIDWVNSEAVQLLQAGGIIKGAPHPNAAKLFWNWLLTVEAQEAISGVGRVPSRPGVKLIAPLLPDSMKKYPARPELQKMYQQLTTVWRESLGLV